jgi:hemerythrin-like domain-containing protein
MISPGGAHRAPGIDDPSHETPMPDILAQWHTEHVNFAKLLNILETQLNLFHDGERPNYELMLDVMFYMTNYPDVLHHPREDLAFARIRELDTGTGPMVDELSKQHARLREAGEQLVRSLSDIVNGSIASRESVEAPGRAYIASFRSHMWTEEKEILPMAATLLRDQDWAAIKAAIQHIDDPLFGNSAERRYASIHEQIARHAQVTKEPAP